jgi:hypothetical protein
MLAPRRLKPIVGIVSGILLIGAMVSRVSAWDRDGENDGDRDNEKVEIGFRIAPVQLNLENKNHDLVGLGSYIVNAQSACNDCHSPTGPMGPEEYVPGNNPFFGQKPTKVNAAVYLSGGNNFGPVGPGSPNIISRNLTPDKTGLPEGGHTFAQFLQIMRHGKDFDHLHPPCTGAPDGTCLPVMDGDGNLLQIMPWPVFQSMTDHDLRAIYEYLSAVPCVEGPTDPTNPLHNDCP